MKKKVITAVLCGLLITGLAGCGKQAEPPEKTIPDSTVTAEAISTPDSETGDATSAAQTTSQESETPTPATPETKPQAEETESPPTPPAESQPKKETTPAQTEQAKPAPAAPETQPQQEPQETPAEVPPAQPTPAQPETPAEPETPPHEAQPKTAYDFEFDIEAIKADCIGIGQGMGLTLDASLTPDNASWWNPVTASQSNQGEALKQNLAGYIRFHTADNLSAYGMDDITHFNIYCEARGNGVYSIYFLFA
ncbi:hypothetical protein [Hominifimenecus sp. rT4P-3]|uniref:hypothetical protein n=1 Tax=Hominifimenecus sp. rT4P-3 TaxID=3242979 RepID=UPI003DA3CB9F